MFKRIVSLARIYGEYGCGDSTVWVAVNTSAHVVSVDTSSEWCEIITDRLNQNGCLATIMHCDFGPVGAWGRPVSFEKRDTFDQYLNALWCQLEIPDVVLIDGRFRVACFLTSLLNAKVGTKIIFDDFSDRPGYSVACEFLQPIDYCGTQCLFNVPDFDGSDRKTIKYELDRFRLVMD